jgi:hypothetical protein
MESIGYLTLTSGNIERLVHFFDIPGTGYTLET